MVKISLQISFLFPLKCFDEARWLMNVSGIYFTNSTLSFICWSGVYKVAKESTIHTKKKKKTSLKAYSSVYKPCYC